MPVFRSTALIQAPPRTVAGLLRDTELTEAALRRDGHRLDADARLLAPGSEVRLSVRLLPALSVPVRLVVEAVSEQELTAVSTAGPLRWLRHRLTLTPTGAGTLVLDELAWTSPYGPLGRAVDVALLRRRGWGTSIRSRSKSIRTPRSALRCSINNPRRSARKSW